MFATNNQSNLVSVIPGNEAYIEEDDDSYQTYLAEENESVQLAQNLGEDRLYPGRRMNKTEALILIFAFSIRRKLPNTGIEELLTLINALMPEDTMFPKSVILLEKLLGADYSSSHRHYYCDQCDTLLLDNRRVCEDCSTRPCKLCKNILFGGATICSMCGGVNEKPLDGKFFVTFDISNSLTHVLRTPVVQASVLNYFQKRTESDGTLRDIIDGQCYQQLKLQGHDISCCINTDGAAIFKSVNNYSIWPVFLFINELDYSLRRKHIILGGLWWGLGKPNFDLFLNPLVEAVEELSTKRSRWDFFPNPVPSKVVFPLFATDAVAKRKFQGMTQFNGEYGCPWCIIKGEALRDAAINFKKWIYNPKLIQEKRTDEGYRNNARELCGSLQNGRMEKENVFGITSASQLLLFKSLHTINGNAFDFMHTGLLGVLKTLTTAFFEPNNHEMQYYLGRCKSQVNKRILLCKFPSDNSRVLRPLDQIKSWKASEWKLWMILSNSILDGLLPFPYLKHLASLTNFLSLLLQDEINAEDLSTSETLANSFCNLVPNLYGEDYHLFNVHILRPAVDCVRNWGPLWCYSLFQFESRNNVLLNSFSGTRKIGEQIVHRTIRSEEVYAQSELVFTNDFAKLFCESLLDHRKLFVKSKKLQDCTLLGPPKPYQLSLEETKLLFSASIPTEGEANCFHSFFCKAKNF